MKRGTFIVIDGTDGSGKKTQADLLAAHVRKQGTDVVAIDFPRYGKPSAYFVEQYLNGRYGSIDEVNFYQGSLFYALDRYDASFEIRNKLKQGTIVICNRYTSSNMGHQGAKIADAVKRKKFLQWLHHLEFDMLNIPQPDVTIILHVPAAIGQKLVDGKGHRTYLGAEKRDLHEENLAHLTAAEAVYLEIARMPGCILVECMRDGKLMTREEIHSIIWERIQPLLGD